MSPEFFAPENRQATDVLWSITSHEGLEWESCTQKLADDFLATTELMARNIDKPLPGGYTIDVVAHEIEEPQIIILRSPAELADIDQILQDTPPTKSAIWLRMMPHDGTDQEKPVIIFDNDDEWLRLHMWGPSKAIPIRGSMLTIRQKRSWLLWDYHKTKKNQGRAEEDFPGSKWEPTYLESILKTDEDGQGEDLVSLLYELDLSVKQAQDIDVTEDDMSPRALAEQKQHYSKIKTEVFTAAGFSAHQTFGQNVLQEAHDVLATIRAFVEKT